MDVQLKLQELKEAERRFNNKSLDPKIQRIPILLRQSDVFRKYCTPKMISMGLIHHGNENLKEGEHYKLLWASSFVGDQDAQVLFERIKDKIEELKELFSEDVIQGYKDDELTWMLFVDGCSLLHFMEFGNHPEIVNLKLDQYECVLNDIMMVENQLPRRLLELLSPKELSDLIRYFSEVDHLENCDEVELVESSTKAIHHLDHVRWFHHYQNRVHCQIEIEIHDKGGKKVWLPDKNIQDLKAAGIRLVLVKAPRFLCNMWNEVSFTSKRFSGELRLPFLAFHDSSCHEFVNMIAYEMCSDVATEYEISSYFSFLDSLIDTAEDVKEFRLAGVFQNLLESDQDLANLLNKLGKAFTASTSLTLANFSYATPCSNKWAEVKRQIEKHYNSRWRTWRTGRRWLAEAYNTHFKTPWSIIGLFAASLLLVLTFIQTWFTVHPNK